MSTKEISVVSRSIIGLSKTLSICFATIFAVSSFAEEPQVLSLNDAIRLTLKQHPDLVTFSYQQQVSQGLMQQATTKSPLMLSGEIEDTLGSGDYAGISAMQTSLSIAWLLEDKLIDTRINLADKRNQQANFEKEIKALDLAAQTAKIFIKLLSQQEQLKLARLAKKQTIQALEQISIRVKAGKLNLIDQLRAKADLSKKSLVVEDLIHEIEASKSQLVAQWSGKSEFTTFDTLLVIPAMVSLNDANEKLRKNPRIKLFASQQRVIESEILLAKISAEPAWKLNAGIKRNESIDDFAFTAGFTIPLGSKDRNQGKIIALTAQQSQAQAQADAWFSRMSTQVLLLTHKIKHNQHVINGLSNETIPALEQANTYAEQAYKTGNYRYSDWYLVQQELIGSQRELITAYTNIQLFNIELERLTGVSLSR